MGDDTRDIAIRTATKVDGIEAKMDTALLAIESLKADFNERRGAEKVARWLIAGGAGTISALVTKFGTMVFNTPMPK